MPNLYKLEKVVSVSRSHIKSLLLRNRVNALWWSGVKNFGDLLTPELLGCYGKTAVNSSPERADFIGVGSILHLLPKGYKGTILGSGCIKDEWLDLEQAHFAFVRGESTKRLLKLDPSTPTGDLGLLAPKLLKKGLASKKYKVGLIPHYVDRASPWIALAMEQLGGSGTLINVKNSAATVINQIQACDLIYSSSLHGIIVADSLKIPNVWLEISDSVVGKGFKFFDYNSCIDYEQIPVQVKSISRVSMLEKFACEKSQSRIHDKYLLLDSLMHEIFSA